MTSMNGSTLKATTDTTDFMKNKAETHRKFHDLARASFPNVGEPGAVWVLSEVLGWPMERIERVSVGGFSQKSYRLFQLDSDGKRLVKNPNTEKGEVVTVTRKWTQEEKALLKDWWWLLGF